MVKAVSTLMSSSFSSSAMLKTWVKYLECERGNIPSNYLLDENELKLYHNTMPCWLGLLIQ